MKINYKNFPLYKKIRIPVKEFVMKLDRIKNKRIGIREAPSINDEVIRMIEEELKHNPDIESIRTIKVDREEYDEWESRLGFQEFYDKRNNPRYVSKILQYMLAFKILELEGKDKNFKYIDAASANSPWAIWLREQYGIMTWSVDLEKPTYKKDYYLQDDITKMPFDDESIDAISMQSSLETFPGDVDIRFMKEAGRVLREGGKLLITPLYLSVEYANCFGKKYYQGSEAEKGAHKYIRLGYSGETTRLYDVEHLIERLLITGKESKLRHTILIFDTDKLLVDKWDKYIYLHFGLLFYKDK